MTVKVLDAKGEHLIRRGDRVTNTNAETEFKYRPGEMQGTVRTIEIGPPVVAVDWDEVRGPAPFWHSVDLMWRCPDLELIDPPTSKQEASK